jgi:hypothetical protein
MANRYWVGGNGTWNSTNTAVWSASSGGASGASVPTAADSVFFDQATTYTVNMTGGGILCLDFTVSAGTVTFANTGAVTISGSMSLSANTVWTNTGQITFNATTTGKTITTNGVSLGTPAVVFNGVGGSWQLQTAVTVNGASATVTLTNGTLDLNNKTLTTGLFSSSNSNTRTIAFGTGNITVVSPGTNWNTATVTGLTITGTPVVNVSYSGATACTIATGALSEANAISFNFTTGTYTAAFANGSGYAFKNVDFTGFAGTWSLGINNTPICYGNLKFSTGMTPSLGSATSFTFGATSGTKTITSNGKVFPNIQLYWNGVGGTWQLQDAFSCTATSSNKPTLTNGTIDLNGQTMTVNFFVTATGTKNLTFNGGTLVVAGGSTIAGFENSAPTGFTTTAGTGTGKISMSSATAKSFIGGGSTFNCTLSNDGAGTLIISGNNTFTGIANGVQPTTFQFTAGSTNTFTNFSVSGTSGNLVTLNSTSTGTYTLSQASGIVSCDYLSISRSVATGGAAFYAGASSTNGGNNTGWIFSGAPIASLNGFFSFF